MKKYTSDYSFSRRKWCVYEQQTASLKTVYHACTDKTAAVKLAERLNEKEEKRENR
jgi:hypothetical protein